MRSAPGPVRVRIETDSLDAGELFARAGEDGLVLVGPDEPAELVARPSGGGERRPPPPGARGLNSGLSPRELEILEYLVDGWSNAEIASALRIGVRTVRFHLGNIYSDMGVSRRGEAVREALRRGLVRFDF